ncbi:unnamed protein product [Symbiodinium sp. CCMP2592]|nr:unnamed protein product [Symbiodinium sp. CCMP2592]
MSKCPSFVDLDSQPGSTPHTTAEKPAALEDVGAESPDPLRRTLCFDSAVSSVSPETRGKTQPTTTEAAAEPPAEALAEPSAEATAEPSKKSAEAPAEASKEAPAAPSPEATAELSAEAPAESSAEAPADPAAPAMKAVDHVPCRDVEPDSVLDYKGAPERTAQFIKKHVEGEEDQDDEEDAAETSKPQRGRGRGGKGRGRGGKGRGKAPASNSKNKKGKGKGKGKKPNKKEPAEPLVTPAKKTKEADPESGAKPSPKRGRAPSSAAKAAAKKSKVEPEPAEAPLEPAAKPKQTPKAKASPKKAAVAKPATAKPKAKGKAKAQDASADGDSAEGGKATFASRNKPKGGKALLHWTAIRDAFNDHVRDTILTPGKREDPFWAMVKPKLAEKPGETYEVYFAMALDCVDQFRASLEQEG